MERLTASSRENLHQPVASDVREESGQTGHPRATRRTTRRSQPRWTAARLRAEWPRAPRTRLLTHAVDVPPTHCGTRRWMTAVAAACGCARLGPCDGEVSSCGDSLRRWSGWGARRRRRHRLGARDSPVQNGLADIDRGRNNDRRRAPAPSAPPPVWVAPEGEPVLVAVDVVAGAVVKRVAIPTPAHNVTGRQRRPSGSDDAGRGPGGRGRSRRRSRSWRASAVRRMT